ncbi:sugar ABC transporter permease [Cohnella sp. LGH]|uniref:ABC transporter permease n=1 Tax=Cohnella sp. LGH TaxID=1619153 RepID=UPI001FFE1261|nr:ABC transporter permease subunit [Cohnella sp. LGH]
MTAAVRSKSLGYLKRYWVLYAMLLLPVSFFIIFRYIPMNYIQIAFKDYSIVKSPMEMEWAANHGFEYFIKAFSNRDFLFALRNTLLLNFLDLVFGFPAPIILAIIFNELAFKRFKKFTQTVAYMPHFLSWIIVAGMALQLFAPSSGLVNIMLNKLGVESIPFLNDSMNWVITYVALGIWKSVGWGTILYLAAIAGINPELYEAASVDGAGRMRNIWHITLPGLRSTIIVLLILNLGHILGSEFDRPFALANKLVTDVSNVISIFVYNYGIRGLQFSLSTAVGLFQSVVGVIFLFGANALAKKFGERGIW